MAERIELDFVGDPGDAKMATEVIERALKDLQRTVAVLIAEMHKTLLPTSEVAKTVAGYKAIEHAAHEAGEEIRKTQASSSVFSYAPRADYLSGGSQRASVVQPWQNWGPSPGRPGFQAWLDSQYPAFAPGGPSSGPLRTAAETTRDAGEMQRMRIEMEAQRRTLAEALRYQFGTPLLALPPGARPMGMPPSRNLSGDGSYPPIPYPYGRESRPSFPGSFPPYGPEPRPFGPDPRRPSYFFDGYDDRSYDGGRATFPFGGDPQESRRRRSEAFFGGLFGAAAAGGRGGRGGGFDPGGLTFFDELFSGIAPGGGRARTGALALGGLVGGAGLSGVGAAGLGVGVGGLASIGVLTGQIATLATALSGLGDAIGGDKEAFDELDATSQQFVQHVRGFIPILDQIQAKTREGLFPGLMEAMDTGLNERTMGVVKDGLFGIAQAMGAAAVEWGKWIGSEDFATRTERILSSSADITGIWSDTLLSLADALVVVVDAGMPLLEWMSEGVASGAEWLDTWIRGKEASGELAEALEGTKDEFALIGDVIAAVAGLAWELAQVLEPLGKTILRDLVEVVEDLTMWFEKNREEIQDQLLGAYQGLVDIVSLLWPILETLMKVVYDVIEAFGGFEVAVEFLLLGSLAVAIGKVAFAIKASLLPSLALVAAHPAIAALLAITAAAGIVVATGDKDKPWWQRLLPFSPGTSDGTGTPPTAGSHNVPIPGAEAQGGKTLPQTFKSTHETSGLSGYPAVDISYEAGKAVGAPAAGVIRNVHMNARQDYKAGFGGWTLYLDDDQGGTYFITHLGGVVVKNGQRVKRGQTIGYSTKTAIGGGIHIHQGYNAPGAAGGSDTSRTTPPPFDDTTTPPTKEELQRDQISRIEGQIATADRSPGVRDDIAARRRAVRMLDRLVPKIDDPQLKTQVKERINGLQEEIDRLLEEVPISGKERRGLRKQLDMLGEGFRALPKEVRERVGPELRQLRELWEDILPDGVNPEEARKFRQAIAAYTRLVNEEAREFRRRVKREAVQQFEESARDLSRSFFEAFDEETRKHKTPTEMLLERLNKERTEGDLQRRVDEARKALEEAMRGTTEGGSQDAMKEITARYKLGRQIEIGQLQILGGDTGVSSLMDDFLRELEGAMSEAVNVVDQQAVKDAQENLEQALYDQRIYYLELQAEAEREAYETQRDALRDHLEQQLEAWMTFLTMMILTGKVGYEGALSMFQAFLDGLLEIGPNGTVQSSITGDEEKYQDPDPPDGPNTGSGNRNFIPLAAGGILTGPVFLAGEAGDELVSPLPVNWRSMQAQALYGEGGGANVTVAINSDDELLGELLSRAIDVRVIRNTSAIADKMGRMADRRAREGRL